MKAAPLYERLRSGLLYRAPRGWVRTVDAALLPADLVTFLGRAMVSPDVPPRVKAVLLLAGLYGCARADFIPDSVFGVLGFADDGLLVLEALHRLFDEVHPSVIRELWPGDPGTLEKLKRFVSELREGSHRLILTPVLQSIRQAFQRFRATA